MQREEELELIRRALDGIEHRRSDQDGEPFELTVDRYLDPAVLDRERAAFRSLPVAVAFASEVADPGAFVTHDRSGVPIVVTRDREGVLRAFVNACRHRGTRVIDGCGRAERLVCPYHGWAYGLGGKLEGVPHRDEFAGINLDDRGLVEVPVETRFGLVFVGPARKFGFAADLDFLADHVLFAPTIRSRAMNWKLMMDGSWESYHFRVTHARTIAPMFFDNLGVFDFREPDIRMVLPKRSIAELHGAPLETWSAREHANLLYGVFPNTIVLVQPDHAMVVTAWPDAVDRTTVVAGMLIPEAPKTEKSIAHWKKNEEIFWNAIEEDVAMGERIQSTLTSGANRSLLFGRCEHLVAKFHRTLESASLAACVKR